MILLDTWAWVEYFKGTKNGEKIANIIKTEQTYTSAISIAELSKWFYDNNADIEIAINQLKENSIILELNDNILIEAGRLHSQLRKTRKKIGIIDTIIYATSLIKSLEVLTNDSDFLGLPNVKNI